MAVAPVEVAVTAVVVVATAEAVAVVAAVEIAETAAIAGTAGSLIVSSVFAPLLLTKIVLRLGFAFRPVASLQMLSRVLPPNPLLASPTLHGFIHRPV